jgi:cell division septation protein DedD
MSVQEYALPDLPGIAESLFTGRCVVAVTPAAGDSEWATKAAWSIARAAAATGRRTALIDLHIDDPSLHVHANNPLDTGIVDAFLFGASLQHVASPDENPNLHFIGVGTPSAETEEVLANKRWHRLSRGFQKEEAVLVVFVPSEELGKLSLEPDLTIALSPNGFGAVGPRSPYLRSALDRGLPLVVVRNPPDENVAEKTSESGREDSRRKFLFAIVGVVATVLVVASVLLLGQRQTAQSPIEIASEPAERSPSTVEDSISQDERVLPVVPTPSGPVDTLAYSIQVAAWASPEQAFEHYRELTSAGVLATISAVPRDSTRVWYRVFAGAVADRAAAADLRARLWAQGTIGSVRGVLANTPLTYLLATHPDTVSGQRAVEGLRETGIPAYIVSMPDGSAQILVGAFESPDQAELADSVRWDAGRGLSKVLVTRVGIAR